MNSRKRLISVTMPEEHESKTPLHDCIEHTYVGVNLTKDGDNPYFCDEYVCLNIEILKQIAVGNRRIYFSSNDALRVAEKKLGKKAYFKDFYLLDTAMDELLERDATSVLIEVGAYANYS